VVSLQSRQAHVHRTYAGAVVASCGVVVYDRELSPSCYGLHGDLVEQLLEHLFRVVELGFHFLEHGEVLDYLLRKRIDGARKVCQGWEEAGRAVGSLGRLFQPARGESSSKGARIVICRPDRGPTLSRRRSCARRRRHGG
jgi:hypothetical protein